MPVVQPKVQPARRRVLIHSRHPTRVYPPDEQALEAPSFDADGACSRKAVHGLLPASEVRRARGVARSHRGLVDSLGSPEAPLLGRALQVIPGDILYHGGPVMKGRVSIYCACSGVRSTP